MAPFLGLDYGLRRIGVAVSDSGGSLATAVHTHQSGSEGSFFIYLDRLIRERHITEVVIGLPLTAHGEEGEMAVRVRAFARKVAAHTGLPVTLEDERFSSREAQNYLHMSGRRRRSKAEVDAVAAEIILQQFLDRRRRGGRLRK